MSDRGTSHQGGSDRDRLIDFVLGELPPDEAHAVAERIAREPEAAAERDDVLACVAALREAAAPGWEAHPGESRGRLALLGRRWLKPALVAAGLLAAVLVLFQRNGVGLHPDAVYEPDGAFGYLLPEEVDSAGGLPGAGDGDNSEGYVLRRGRALVSAIGAQGQFELGAGARIANDSSVETPSDGGARIDLPGGVLFLGPFTEIHLRRHQDGGAALRLKGGAAAFVAVDRPIRAAVDDSALLVRLDRGAALLRPSEALCLRGDLFLRVQAGGEFRIPAGERLPAACAKEPWTEPYRIGDLELDWYEALVYEQCRSEAVVWREPGRSTPITADADTLVFLRLIPDEAGELKLAFGAKPRTFALRKGVPLTLRLRLHDLGPGPELTLSAPKAVREARLFAATPR